MNIAAAHNSIDASQIPLESLAGNTSLSDTDKVAEVSRQFEAVLLRQIMQDIRKPVLAAGEGDPTISGIYGDMINNQLADSISRSGAFGVAKSLTGQLTHQVLGVPASEQQTHSSAQASIQTVPTKKQ